MCGIDIDGDDLGQLVRMQGDDALAQRVEAFAHGFDHEKMFVVAAELALPATRRDDAGDAVDAGGEAFLDERGGEAFAALRVGAGA